MGIGWVGGGGLMWVSTETDPPFPYHEPLIPTPNPTTEPWRIWGRCKFSSFFGSEITNFAVEIWTKFDRFFAQNFFQLKRTSLMPIITSCVELANFSLILKLLVPYSSLLCWYFLNKIAYHLGQYEPHFILLTGSIPIHNLLRLNLDRWPP